jgi:hypothetical protein
MNDQNDLNELRDYSAAAPLRICTMTCMTMNNSPTPPLRRRGPARFAQ